MPHQPVITQMFAGQVAVYLTKPERSRKNRQCTTQGCSTFAAEVTSPTEGRAMVNSESDLINASNSTDGKNPRLKCDRFSL
jgi:hypothetical protein